jgi:hypothetical protein
MQLFSAGVCAISLAILTCNRLCAVQLIYSSYDSINTGYTSLYSVETETGVSTSLGIITPQHLQITGMTYSPSDHSIYTIGLHNHAIYKIAPNTAAAAFVGVVDWPGDPTLQAVGLSFNPQTGDLYALRNFGGIFKISPTDASIISFAPSPDLANFAFNSQGELYARGRSSRLLYLVNPETGSVTQVGDGVIPPDGVITELGDAEFAAGDRLFGIRAGNNRVAPTLFESDTATGAATMITNLDGGLTAGSVFGLVVVPEPPAGILALLSAPAIFVLRRRRR